MNGYERGYRDGYRDGAKDFGQPQTKGPRCTKCGTTSFEGYVCTQSHCPMMPVTYAIDPEWQRDHERSKY